MKHFCWSITAFFMLFSCHLQHPAATAQPEEVSTAAEEPEILFLHLKVSKKDGGIAGQIADKKQVPGRLNQDIRGVQVSEGEWLVSLLDKKGKMVTQVAVANPLEEHYEVADDQGQLRSIEVKKEEADCFIRVQYDPRFAGLQIEQIGPAQQRTTIISLYF